MNLELSRARQHIYVHVPFCDGTCAYCAFYSVIGDAAERQRYAPLPGRELRRLLADEPPPNVPETLYIGGGTPARLGVDGFRELTGGLGAALPMQGIREWTVETSPNGATSAQAAAWRACGVNRLSIGAQCFDDGVLRAIGRRHDAAAVVAAVRTARAEGFDNVGLDLIAGLPGLSAAGWRETLTQALDLPIEHLSVYALGLEPGTELMRRVASGEWVAPDAEAQLAALAEAETQCTRAGLCRYEISNYARPGRECRHNLACWRGDDYLGAGPSAASRVGRRRWTNLANLAAYAQNVALGREPPRQGETLEPASDASERFLFGLRLAEGVNPEVFVQRHPDAAGRLSEWQRALERLARQGAVERTGSVWRLTARGREVADAVLAELA